MDANSESWEFILVDDGSTDGSTEKIRELAQTDSRVRPVVFARNFGHQIAITAGWDYARGRRSLLLMPICRIRRRSFWIWPGSGRRATRWYTRCAPNAKASHGSRNSRRLYSIESFIALPM